MDSSAGLQIWALRLCLATVAILLGSWLYFGNLGFVPPAAGFGILAVVCHLIRRPHEEARPLRDSGQHPAT